MTLRAVLAGVGFAILSEPACRHFWTMVECSKYHWRCRLRRCCYLPAKTWALLDFMKQRLDVDRIF
jgi:hypothetical protein